MYITSSKKASLTYNRARSVHLIESSLDIMRVTLNRPLLLGPKGELKSLLY